MLTIITFRPEFTPPWAGQPNVSTLPLTRLGRREGAAMVDRVVGEKALPDEVKAQIVAKTDGVPLFVEELTKAVLESGLLADAGDHYELSGPLPPLAIPATLHEFAARAPRPPRARERRRADRCGDWARVLPRAARGRRAGTGRDRSGRRSTSWSLPNSSSAEVRRPRRRYSFKHALVQDAAYSTLLKSRRQHLHARIAQVLEEQFPEIAETQPELLAHHFTRAGLAEKAVDYWNKAGRRAIARSAMAEAVAQLNQGLEALAGLPEGPERDRRELDLQLSLALPMFAMKWGAGEVERVYARARELCESLNDRSNAFVVLRGLWHCNFTQGLLGSAADLGTEALRLAEESEIAVTVWWPGEPSERLSSSSATLRRHYDMWSKA